jgi:hypothetical protein
MVNFARSCLDDLNSGRHKLTSIIPVRANLYETCIRKITRGGETGSRSGRERDERRGGKGDGGGQRSGGDQAGGESS